MTITLQSTHRGAGPRYVPRSTPRRPVALLARTATANGARYAVGPHVNLRRLATALATIATVAVALVALGMAGRSDMQRACDDAWRFGTAGASETRATCADTFPDRYPATDHY